MSKRSGKVLIKVENNSGHRNSKSKKTAYQSIFTTSLYSMLPEQELEEFKDISGKRPNRRLLMYPLLLILHTSRLISQHNDG